MEPQRVWVPCSRLQFSWAEDAGFKPWPSDLTASALHRSVGLLCDEEAGTCQGRWWGDMGSFPWCGLWSRLGRSLHVGEAPIQEPHVQSSTPQREMDRLEERAGMQGREELELWSLAT